MGFQLVQTRTEDISHKRAQELLRSFNNFEGQRPLGMDWSQYLANEMREGTFTKGAISLAENGSKKTYIVNGQHQLQAAVLAEKTIRATVDTYHCDTEADFWRLYAKFDVHRGRTDKHVMAAARGLFQSEKLREVDFRTLAACGTALVWLGGGIEPQFTGKVLSKTMKPSLVERYENDVLFVRDVLVAASNARPVVGVIAAIIATNRVTKGQCFDFWRRVLGGFELAKNSPEWYLHKDIAGGLIPKIGGKGGGRHSYVWNLCLAWWDSYATETPRRSVKLEAIKGLLKVSPMKRK